MALALKELVGVELLFASVLGAGIRGASARAEAEKGRDMRLRSTGPL